MSMKGTRRHFIPMLELEVELLWIWIGARAGVWKCGVHVYVHEGPYVVGLDVVNSLIWHDSTIYFDLSICKTTLKFEFNLIHSWCFLSNSSRYYPLICWKYTSQQLQRETRDIKNINNTRTNTKSSCKSHTNDNKSNG